MALGQTSMRTVRGTFTGSQLDFSCLHTHLFNTHVPSAQSVPGTQANTSLCRCSARSGPGREQHMPTVTFWWFRAGKEGGPER